MLSNLFTFVKAKGSSLSLPAHGWVGARATLTLAAHFALRNTRSNPVEKLVRRNFFGAKPKQAGKKEGGWGEGIFARSCLPFPFRLRKEKAEGGFGGNSAFLLRNQIVDSPAVLLVKSRTTQKSFLFLLEEKIGRAQNKKLRRKLFCGTASEASGGGAERQFRSKKFRAKCRISHQSQLSPFWERIASRLRRSAFGLCARRKAIKSHGGQKEKEMDLSKNLGFVPTF